jgi:hypothetical protein
VEFAVPEETFAHDFAADSTRGLGHFAHASSPGVADFSAADPAVVFFQAVGRKPVALVRAALKIIFGAVADFSAHAAALCPSHWLLWPIADTGGGKWF